MLLSRSPLPSSHSSSSASGSHHLGYRPPTHTQLSSLRSPILLSSTPRKRPIPIDVQSSPADQLNLPRSPRPLKKICNRLDFTSKNNGGEREAVTHKGDINNREKGVNTPLNATIIKMDVEMDTNSMEGVIIQPKPSLPPSPSFSSSSTSSLHSTARPRLGRLDTSSSLDFEPGLSVRSYPSSSSINDMSNSPPKPSSLPPVMHLKRNPKKLSLSLPPLATSTTAYSSNSSPNCSTPSTVCPTPTYSTAESDSKFGTPYTPGPPKTPALAMSLGRSTFRGNRRPSLLSLITNPPGNDDVPPPTPGAVSHPYATMRLKNKGRARSQTAIDVLGLPDQHHQTSAFGNSTFPPINEADNHQHSSGLSALGYALPTTSSPRSQSSAYNGSSPTTSTSTVSDDASASASTSSTPSTSPPLPTAFTFAMPLNNYNHHPAKRQMEPYEDGPIEILPGIFLGAEESVFQFDSYAPSSSKVRIINVAQEIDDPFDPSNSNVTPGWSRSKGKQKMKFAMYPASTDGSNQRPEIEYCHVRWSHGELGLADIPDEAELAHLLDVPDGDLRNLQGTNGDGIWGFWETIKWMEGGRRNGIPILIHCQCGVSRSATLAIAYTMALAAIGAMPDILGGIRSMQDAYDFVKLKSSWIGPNHSLVFQLVDFARHLTQLLSTHPDTMQTSFPCNHDAELSEAEWARRRREFEESENGSVTSASSSEEKEKERGRMEGGCCISPEEADEEARRLDEEMLLRKARR